MGTDLIASVRLEVCEVEKRLADRIDAIRYRSAQSFAESTGGRQDFFR